MLISKNFACWEQSHACFKPCMALWPNTFVQKCLWPFFQTPQMSPQSDHSVRADTEVTAARKDPVERPNLWWTSSLKGCSGWKGFRACEIITVLNLSSHGQLVTADTRLRVIRPYLSLSPLPCAFFLSTGLSYPFSLNWRDEKYAGMAWYIMESKDNLFYRINVSWDDRMRLFSVILLFPWLFSNLNVKWADNFFYLEAE